MKNLVKKCTVIPLIIFISACGGDGSENSTNEPLQYASAHEYVSESGFNGSILVSRSKVDILRSGFGYANKSNLEQNTVETKYRIGSLTKAFTALAIIQLKNSGLIASYDDSLSTYFPEFNDVEKITLRHLLNHRSGLPDYVELTDNNLSYTPSQLVNLVIDKNRNFEPGTKFEYANINYVLLGYIIERVTHTDYHEYIDINIFQPLGLVNTEKGTNIISGEGYATGYKEGFVEAEYHDMSIPYSAGSLSSNLIDMETWAYSFQDLSLISQQDFEEIFGQDSYGFGWDIGRDGNVLVYSHTGGIAGFSSIIVIAPEVDGLIVALSNDESFAPTLGSMISTIVQHEFK